MNFQEKERLFKHKYNIEGWDYYKGGIYKRLSASPRNIVSNFTQNFDWRDRHNSNIPNTPYYDNDINAHGWITPFANSESNPNFAGQGSCNSCTVFSAVAVAEALVNIFYNSHDPVSHFHYDINLSEQQILCDDILVHCTGGSPEEPMSYFVQPGKQPVVTETCLPYTEFNYPILQVPPPPIPPCPWCSDLSTVPNIKMESYVKIATHPPIPDPPPTLDMIREALIKYGPLSSGHHDMGHAMALVGYGTAKAGDLVYKGAGPNDPDIIIEQGSSIIGQNIWWFKDSQSTGQPQFAQVQGDQSDLDDCYYFNGKVLSQNTNLQVKCSDEDKDGYYWWGTGTNPQECGCLPGVNANEEDCNDNNKNSGPYNTATYECMQNNCITSESILTIGPNTSDNTWINDRHVNQNIIIENGGILTVKASVFFTPNARIIVKPGGLLKLSYRQSGSIIYPSRLSSGCQDFWGGIELRGDPTQKQLTTNQGMVILDHAIIEDAVCGIRTFNPGPSPLKAGVNGGVGSIQEGYSSGGIINADNSTFRNNKTSVEFCAYRQLDPQHPNFLVDNKSYFNRCVFSDSLLLNNATPGYLLKFDGVNKVKIRGCTFINKTVGSSVQFNKKGRGIYAFNSALSIDRLDSDSTTFQNLEYGIYSLHSGISMDSIHICRSRFFDNLYGVNLSGLTEINPTEVNSDHFNLKNYTDAASRYMLYFDNCTGFHATLNKFRNLVTFAGEQNYHGIIVNNSGTHMNYIYNNNFSNIKFALQGQNYNWGYYIPKNLPSGTWNASALPTIGLCFICNDFSSCKNDIVINDDPNYTSGRTGIQYYQRNVANPANPSQEPAGNTFSLNHTPSNPDFYDVNIDATVSNIQYSFHTTPQNGIDLRLKPTQISIPDKVTYNAYPITISYTKSTSCPERVYPTFTPTELKTAIENANLKIDSLMKLLNRLVDSGSTENLKNNVETSTSNQSYDIYQDLMAPSPYLTDSVVKASIEKENVLPNSMIRDIMVANPQSAKNDDLLSTLDNRITPMPDPMWAEIMEGKDLIGAKEQLESELSGWLQTKWLYFSQYMNLLLQDTLHTWANDSLITLLQNDFSLNPKYNLVGVQTSQDNYIAAQNTLEEMPYNFPFNNEEIVCNQNFSAILPILKEIVNDSIGYVRPDSLQTIMLKHLAEQDNFLPGAFARNILIAGDQSNYREPIIEEITLKSSRNNHYSRTKSNSIIQLNIYPNPCKDYVTIEYTKENPKDYYLATLINSTGISLSSYILRKASDQFILPLQQLPSGSYLISIDINGIRKDVRKIIIVK